MRDEASSTRMAPVAHEEQSVFSGEKPHEAVQEATETRDAPAGDTTLECDFDVNPSMLYKAIQKKNWSVAVKRAEEAPAEAMTWVSRKERDGRLRWKLLPLHAAVIFKAPEDVVEALLGSFPKAAQLKDDHGMLPIHLAFRHGSSEEVVELLLLSYPKSIDEKDRKGRIPLDLAQASTSPNRDAFVKAVSRGPSYYAAAAAATERAAVTAEQRTIFEAQISQTSNKYQQEMSSLKEEFETTKKSYEQQVEDLKKELATMEETSQVLVDHVSSLEAQLASRGDTERFLATKIADLDSSLKETSKTKEQVAEEITAELSRALEENETLKAKIGELQLEEGVAKDMLNQNEQTTAESLTQSKKALAQSQKLQQKQAETIRNLEADLICQRSHVDTLETRMKNKVAIEQTLAMQVSTLASQLAESAADTTNANRTYTLRIEQLEMERTELRSTVGDLTDKLARVARILNSVNAEQERIAKVASNHEKTMIECTGVNDAFVEHASVHDEIAQQQEQERQELLGLVEKLFQQQQKEATESKKRRDLMVEQVEVIKERIASSRDEREAMMFGIVNQRMEMGDLIESALSVVPNDSDMDEDDIVNEVVKRTMKSIKTAQEEEQLATTSSDTDDESVEEEANDEETPPSTIEEDAEGQEELTEVKQEASDEADTEVGSVNKNKAEEIVKDSVAEAKPEQPEEREEEEEAEEEVSPIENKTGDAKGENEESESVVIDDVE